MSLLGLEYRSYGGLLLALRKRAGLNLSKAAQEVGANPQVLADVESDRRPLVRFSRVRVFLFAKLYGVVEADLHREIDRFAPLSALEKQLLARDIADARLASQQWRYRARQLATIMHSIAERDALCIACDDLDSWIARAESVIEETYEHA